MGKIWSMAQLSGMDWKIDRLQKYVSVSRAGSLRRSSGT